MQRPRNKRKSKKAKVLPNSIVCMNHIKIVFQSKATTRNLDSLRYFKSIALTKGFQSGNLIHIEFVGNG